MSIPRGVALNNPLNLRNVGITWVGLTTDQPDADFCKFRSPEYGFRAAFKDFRTCQVIHGIRTIRALIERWAPPSENPTEAYIANVCARTDKTSEEVLDLTAWADASIVVQAMTVQEQGSFVEYFTWAQLRDGALLAGVAGVPDHDY